ncbi:MAG: class I SAM-dependent methyltransferase [Rubrobacter sp.]|nr:class I SAM-dependent methyltransferase [Rubrobacter sp.]
MAEPSRDKWSEWLLARRDGGDPEQRKKTLEFLAPVRGRVLDNADLSGGETLLDVGAGDGLIAFGALDKVGEDGTVVFSDISRDLLEHSEKLAKEMGESERCRFIEASADDLSDVESSSMDVVTTRSVLIYVEDKRRAFEEFHRVLKPGGRLSIFEPINRFNAPSLPSDGRLFMGYDTASVRDLARKVWTIYDRRQPRGTDPMLDFDERDLLALAEDTGFEEISLEYEAKVAPASVFSEEWGWTPSWERLLKSSGNPKAPTLEEAMDEALSPEERERFAAHLRPLVERGERTMRDAVAYLRSVKNKEA